MRQNVKIFASLFLPCRFKKLLLNRTNIPWLFYPEMSVTELHFPERKNSFDFTFIYLVGITIWFVCVPDVILIEILSVEIANRRPTCGRFPGTIYCFVYTWRQGYFSFCIIQPVVVPQYSQKLTMEASESDWYVHIKTIIGSVENYLDIS